MTWPEAWQRLAQIEALQPDYDCEGSDRPEPEKIDRARSIMKAMEAAGLPAPDPMPVPVRDLLLEWRFGEVAIEWEVRPHDAHDEIMLWTPGLAIHGLVTDVGEPRAES